MPSKPSRQLTMVTPWPPQPSGIADYAKGLRDGLQAAGFSVDVFTNAETSDDVHHVGSVDELITALSRYNRILLQLGNHPFFHGYMAPITAALGERCVVELHDVRLDHMLPGLNYSGDPNFIERWLRANYGTQHIVSDARPISDLICRQASRVIVHSQYAADWLRRLGITGISVVDLSYDLDRIWAARNGELVEEGIVHLGIFGTFQKSRQIPLVLDALEILHSHNVHGWHLHLVGRPCEGYQDLLSSLAASPVRDRVTIHESVPLERFLALLRAMDVHVALRSPTVGETSGVVVQGIALGVPTIVTNVGWYAELPEIVEKIPEQGGLFKLTAALYRHITDSDRRRRVSAETKSFATEAYDIRSRAEEIGQIIVNG